MPRKPKPRLHQGHYISEAGGEYVKLCPKADGMARAKVLLQEHLEKRDVVKMQNQGRVSRSLTVSVNCSLSSWRRSRPRRAVTRSPTTRGGA